MDNFFWSVGFAVSVFWWSLGCIATCGLMIRGIIFYWFKLVELAQEYRKDGTTVPIRWQG